MNDGGKVHIVFLSIIRTNSIQKLQNLKEPVSSKIFMVLYK